MVEELISTLSKEIRTSITEDTSVPRNVRSNVVTGLETYLLNEKDDLDLRIYSTISVLEEQINDSNEINYTIDPSYDQIKKKSPAKPM